MLLFFCSFAAFVRKYNDKSIANKSKIERSSYMNSKHLRIFMLIADLLISLLSGWIAFQLRFNFLIPEKEVPHIQPIILWISACQLIAFFVWKIYKKSALFEIEIAEIQQLLYAVFTSACLGMGINIAHQLATGLRIIPISILVISHFCMLFLLLSSRLVAKESIERFFPALSKNNENIRENALLLSEKEIAYLLDREPINLDSEAIRNHLTNKVVLVTGAAGSIGRELSRQLSHFPLQKLILLDQAETPLYELDLFLKEQKLPVPYEVVIADVRNADRMRNVFETFLPQIVYHAAAYKHVPMMELNPTESVLTNVIGTKNMADLAVEYGAEKMILVSTDKAVNPTGMMGASKRMAEIYVQSLNTQLSQNKKEHTRFITTRFGNVLGSDGSVLWLFRRQIETGNPITVTHPEVTRYFMTIPEASQLVLEAGMMGNGGEILVFDMGKPIKISHLAKKMIAFSGKNIDIHFVGLRPGEKLYEELLHDKETTLPTHHPKILIGKVQVYDYQVVLPAVLQLKKLFDKQDSVGIMALLKEMIPEYQGS